MEARTIKLEEICPRDGGRPPYSLDTYQRDFEWSTETGPVSRPGEWRAEVQDFWEDLHDFVHQGGRSHFFGVLLLDPTSGHDLRIVDGQQRITCVFLLLLAIRDHLIECREHSGVEIPFECRWLEATKFSERLILNADSLNGRLADREALELISRRDTRNTDLVLHPLVRAYRFFKQKVAARFGNNHTDLVAFLNQIGQNVTFLEVRLAAGDDPKRMFERLNARGRQVTPTLLLENLLSFQDQTRNHPIASEALQLLTSLQETFSESDLRSFLTLLPKRLAIETVPDADYARFKKYRETAERRNATPGADPLRDWLDEIRRCRELFEMVVNGSSDHSRFNTFHHFATTSLLPAVVRTAEVFGKNSPEVNALECLTFRLFVCHARPSHAYAHLGSRICLALKEVENGAAAQESAHKGFIEALLAADVSDARFKHDFREKPIYGNGQKRGQTRYILERLENQLNHQVPGMVSFQHGCSIEHVYPQRPGEGWPEVVPNDVALYRRWLHTAGNLTVLLIPDNSRFGNLRYERKRSFYLDPVKAVQSDPTLGVPAAPGNLILNHSFSSYPQWDICSIQERGTYLADVASLIWPAAKDQPILITWTISI